MASFYVIRGRDHGQHFVVRGAQCTLGRDSINQIRINDSEPSLAAWESRNMSCETLEAAMELSSIADKFRGCDFVMVIVFSLEEL